MKLKLTFFFLTFLFLVKFQVFGQTYSFKKKFGTQKNAVYIYWGYNRSNYTKSDINFSSPDYDFTVRKVTASDRPVTEISKYFDPKKFTTTQFNFRAGWYYKFRWDISIGLDHMKYVMDANQLLRINGDVGATTTSQLSGTYSDSDGLIPIRSKDLHYENTNGLNYVSLQLNNTAPLFKTYGNKFAIQRRAGVGIGPVVTQTDFNWDGEVFNSDNGNESQRISGYGISIHTGLRFDFFKHFFFQSNWSAGFIHLPKNPTIVFQDHFAKQKFIYGQWELLGGFIFYLRTKNGCDTCPDWN